MTDKRKKNDNDEIDPDVKENCENCDPATEESRHENHHKKSTDEYKRKYDELFDLHVRLKAEYSNYIKRTDKEKELMYDNAKCDMIRSLLPIIDNFERALKAESAHKTHSAFKDGMEKIYKQMIDMLEKENIECINAIGEKFDPELHHAVAHEEDTEKGENEIAEEFQKGYKHKDRVIRHSMVKVVN